MINIKYSIFILLSIWISFIPPTWGMDEERQEAAMTKKHKLNNENEVVQKKRKKNIGIKASPPLVNLTLSTLPKEILLHIFSYVLHPFSEKTISYRVLGKRVCKQWNDLMDDSQLLSSLIKDLPYGEELSKGKKHDYTLTLFKTLSKGLSLESEEKFSEAIQLYLNAISKEENSLLFKDPLIAYHLACIANENELAWEDLSTGDLEFLMEIAFKDSMLDQYRKLNKSEGCEPADEILKAVGKKHADLQYRVAKHYLDGQEVYNVLNLGMGYLLKSVKQKYTPAQNAYGVFLDRSPDDKSKIEAGGWYMVAAEKGYVDAQYNLAVCYEKGKGTPKDLTLAKKWYFAAAKQGHKGAQAAFGDLKGKGW